MFFRGCTAEPRLVIIFVYTDIDECSEGLDDCQGDKYLCFNTEGNYTCQPQHDSKCPAGYKYSKDAASCEGNVFPLLRRL